MQMMHFLLIITYRILRDNFLNILLLQLMYALTICDCVMWFWLVTRWNKLTNLLKDIMLWIAPVHLSSLLCFDKEAVLMIISLQQYKVSSQSSKCAAPYYKLTNWFVKLLISNQYTSRMVTCARQRHSHLCNIIISKNYFKKLGLLKRYMFQTEGGNIFIVSSPLALHPLQFFNHSSASKHVIVPS